MDLISGWDFFGPFQMQYNEYLSFLYNFIYIYPMSLHMATLPIRILEVPGSHLDLETCLPEMLSVVFLIPPGQCWNGGTTLKQATSASFIFIVYSRSTAKFCLTSAVKKNAVK
jgi:hypothetical protein